MFDDDILIHPKRGRKEEPLPENALIVVNPAEAKIAYEEMSSYDVIPRFLYNSKLVVAPSRNFCLAGPSLGAPAAGLILEKLIALGVRNICLFSCCGAINRNCCIGDILVAISGVPGEGVSQYYGDCPTVQPCQGETEKLRQFLSEHQMSWKEGGVWSTDAPYRESRSELTRLHTNHGVDAVDMEFTALCSIASFRNVSLSALFVVSDELWGPDWRPGFTDPVFRKLSKSLISNIIQYNMEGVRNNGQVL